MINHNNTNYYQNLIHLSYNTAKKFLSLMGIGLIILILSGIQIEGIEFSWAGFTISTTATGNKTYKALCYIGIVLLLVYILTGLYCKFYEKIRDKSMSLESTKRSKTYIYLYWLLFDYLTPRACGILIIIFLIALHSPYTIKSTTLIIQAILTLYLIVYDAYVIYKSIAFCIKKIKGKNANRWDNYSI